MMLSVENLSLSYGEEREVLKNVSFFQEKGTLLAVMGPNGAGKSTLFKCVLGSLHGFSGKICWEGQELTGLDGRTRAALMAYIPQLHRPAFSVSVLDVALMGTARKISSFAMPGAEQVKKTWEALERVGIPVLAERNFSELSGGEQQLVLIARALAQDAELLIMDEPTSALDYGNRYKILRLLRELTAEGYSVMLSTHDPQHALTFADSVLALSEGTVTAFGAVRETLTPELIRALYGVRVTLEDTPSGRFLLPDISAEERRKPCKTLL